MERRFDATKPMQVGGQAVIEGVMMRAPGMVATAVRRADGSIFIRKERHDSLADRFRWLRLPLLRGAVGLVEMMILGIRTLNFSAEIALQDSKGGDGIPGAAPSQGRPAQKESMVLWGTVALAFAGALALFFVVPLLIASSIPGIDQLPLVFNLVAGGIRVALLLAYLAVISIMKDVRRLFQYHGAEHKAVFAFEKGLPLTLASVRTQSRFHPRCGTSFLLIVMVSAIMLFAVLDAGIIALTGPIRLVTRLATHLPLVPLVGGISYEFIRLSARHAGTMVGKLVVTPGLWLQRITTNEPDDSQLEVSLSALRSALGEDQVDRETSPVTALPVSVN